MDKHILTKDFLSMDKYDIEQIFDQIGKDKVEYSTWSWPLWHHFSQFVMTLQECYGHTMTALEKKKEPKDESSFQLSFGQHFASDNQPVILEFLKSLFDTLMAELLSRRSDEFAILCLLLRIMLQCYFVKVLSQECTHTSGTNNIHANFLSI
jgi:hypothetical protein